MTEFDASSRQRLLDIADASIAGGLTAQERADPNLSQLAATLLQKRGSFVTVRVRGELNGCMGNVDPERPLALDVARNAFRSAFEDPRFAPLTATQFNHRELEISILTALQPIDAKGPAELCAALRPGIDGLLIHGAGFRATYLPAVWHELPEPGTFVAQLLSKAGLPRHSWPQDTRCARYQTESIVADPPSLCRSEPAC